MFGNDKNAKPEEVTYLVILGRLSRLEIDKLLKNTFPQVWRDNFSKQSLTKPVNKVTGDDKHHDLIADLKTNKLDVKSLKLLSTIFGRVIQNKKEYDLFIEGLTSDSELFGANTQPKVMAAYKKYPQLITLRLLELF